MGENRMSDFTGQKFVASYSGGKDCVLAIYRAIQMGMEPVGLIITYNTENKRSWFHGIPQPVLTQVSASLGIPVTLVKTPGGAAYAENFRAELARQRDAFGAQVCVFGDIDVAGHLEWCTAQCTAVGLTASFPLWQQPRAALVYEGIDLGFRAIITVVDTARMQERHVGEQLTRQRADEIAAEGADICGENGEYHTFVCDGPLFKTPIALHFGEKILSGTHVLLPMLE